MTTSLLLILLSRMRNLEYLTIDITSKMPIHIDIEKDYLYKLGFGKASKSTAEQLDKLDKLVKKTAAKINSIIFKLHDSGMNIQQIGEMVDLTEAEIAQIVSKKRQQKY